MSKKRIKLNPASAQRLTDWLHEIDMTQGELAERIHYSQQYISNIVNCKKPMSLQFAQAVADATSQGKSEKYNIEKRIRPEYLLCLDDIKTTEDLQAHFISFTDQSNNASLTMLDHSLRAICESEGIEPPVIDNIPEMLFLQAQLKDYSDQLMRSYLDRMRGHNTSHVWNFLDQLPDNSSNSEHTS